MYLSEEIPDAAPGGADWFFFVPHFPRLSPWAKKDGARFAGFQKLPAGA
jgi:hypothetical protein